ncbi:MAG: glycosyltransferase [Bacteroidales bacterium]|nr:glycosyltransferase [Bacteroidales bacterium]
MKSIANCFHYVHWIDSTELSAYLEINDICIAPFHKNPQHESGVANKIYDYMLGGKPIIAPNCIPQQNLIEKQNCGLVFENMTEFQYAIIKLLDDSDLRARIGKNGYEAIMKEHHIGMVKENLILLYKTITNKV